MPIRITKQTYDYNGNDTKVIHKSFVFKELKAKIPKLILKKEYAENN